MALTDKQAKQIDSLIGAGKTKPDIVNDLVRNHNADSRDVSKYLAENRTVQGSLNFITRKAKQIVKDGGDEASRKKLAAEIKTEAERAIRILKTAAK